MKRDEATTWVLILIVLAVILVVMWGFGPTFLSIATVGALVLDLFYMSGGA